MMKTAKLTEQYDYKYRSWNSARYSDTKYGFEGTYTNKDLGECYVQVTQDSECNYMLILDVWHKGIEYHRNFKCSIKPSYRLASLKAKEFLVMVRVR